MLKKRTNFFRCSTTYKKLEGRRFYLFAVEWSKNSINLGEVGEVCYDIHLNVLSGPSEELLSVMRKSEKDFLKRSIKQTLYSIGVGSKKIENVKFFW